jgi:protein-disulfide isomerase
LFATDETDTFALTLSKSIRAPRWTRGDMPCASAPESPVPLKQKIEFVTNTILVLCVLAMAVSLVRREFFPATAQAGILRPVAEKEWRKYAVSRMRVGPPAPFVTVTEFSDFECPVCQRLYHSLENIRAKRGNDFAIVYRNYPLTDIHPWALPAAIAAECAAEHGRFTEFYQFVFEHQDSLKGADWPGIAHLVGVADTSAFSRCLDTPAIAERLRADSLAAADLKIPGTPLVLVNGWLYRGAPSQKTLDSLIASEMAAHRTR